MSPEDPVSSSGYGEIYVQGGKAKERMASPGNLLGSYGSY